MSFPSVNEDFVGRIAKQSRRIGFRQVLENPITAYVVKFKFTTKRYFFHRGGAEEKNTGTLA